MSVKISKIANPRALNCKIHPVLYNFYCHLHNKLGAEIVHRRKRKSSMCIEIIYHVDELLIPIGRLNTLPEAEECGFWVMCRPQTAVKRLIYKGHRVFLLFLTPVHPKKRRESLKIVTPLLASEAQASLFA